MAKTTVSEDGNSKTCTKCGLMQPKEDFHVLELGILGRSAWCKTCMNKVRAEWAANNRERTKKQQKEYYENNKEALVQRSRDGRILAYGLSTLDYDELCENGCQICGVFVEKLHIDHDHSCCPGPSRSCGKCVRGGTLCSL